VKQSLPFHHPYRHDFVRVAVAVPRIRVADPAHNAEQTVLMLEQVAAAGASLVALPELGLAAYTSDDLFHQRALLDGCEAALARVAEATARIPVMAIVGLPVRVDHLLFNAAAVVSGGKILGVIPKTYLPNYGEFYEARQFSGADNALSREVTLAGATVPFGNDLIFTATNQPLLRLHAEICEDLWVPIPPSTLAALAGATVLVNLSASNITIGKADYRHQLVGQQSARCQAACLYTSSGVGESTTDMAWDGQALIYEAGDLLAESERFVNGAHFIVADVDLERVSRERMRQNTFGQSVGRFKESLLQGFRSIAFELPVPAREATALCRKVERFPYVPAEPARRDERCAEVYSIQVQALVQRLSASGIDKVVLGISGGLDSTHALLVCARAMDLLGLPRSHILAWTMPGFATSKRTLDQARRLMAAMGCSAGEIDIRPSCKQMLADIGHPYAEGKADYDITFENVQAGERTSHLFRLANLHRAIVVGTGDLSELALGWSTYGVGDHMSHYNVNASVPKTLVKHLVRWVAGNGSLSPEASRVLEEIAATEVSPELVPGDASEKPSQSSEDAVGPYELQDFHLYQVLRYGYAPSKVAFLAWTAWQDTYSLADIKRHLRNFLQRFFKTSQFKRSCVPNAPKVGSGGSLSPRGDWRAPSDSEATVWLNELETVPDA